MSIISTGLRPKRSARKPNSKAPNGRAASVRVTAKPTVLISLPNSAAIAFSMNTIRKKSNASSVQPR